MIEQLDVFLGEATKPFVEKLFNAISSEEYLTNLSAAALDAVGIDIKSAFESDSTTTASAALVASAATTVGATVPAKDSDSIVIKIESNTDNAAAANYNNINNMELPSGSSSSTTPHNDEVSARIAYKLFKVLMQFGNNQTFEMVFL